MIDVGGNDTRLEAVGIRPDLPSGIEQRVVHENGVEELVAFVAGDGVLIEEAEQVHLAESDLERLARVRFEATVRQWNCRLVPGFAEDRWRVVGAHAAGVKADAIDRAGKCTEIAERGVQTAVLADAKVREQLLFDVTKRLEWQGRGDVSAPANLAVVTLGARW